MICKGAMKPKKLLPLKVDICYLITMRIPTEIGGILAVSLTVVTMACSSKDNNYNPIKVYPAGANVMPVDGSPLPATAQSLPPLTPEQIGPTINYTVKQGDSLWLIAKNFKTTISRLKSANQLDSDMILAGQNLKIPDQAGATPAVQPKAAPGLRQPPTTVTPPSAPKAGGGLKIQN